jgi:hypothetical protein
MGLVRLRLPEKYGRVWVVWTNGNDWSHSKSVDTAERQEKYMIGISVEKVVIKKGNSHIQTVDYNSCPPGRHIDVHHNGTLICRVERRHSQTNVNAAIKQMDDKWVKKN